MQAKNFATLALSLVAGVGLSACFHDDDDTMPPPMASYTITVTNVTNAQPMTPLAVVMHKPGYLAWQAGSAASAGLEMLAESGSPSDFLAEADADTNVMSTAASTGGPFGAGGSASVSMNVAYTPDLQLSLASMLANTNDAFTGLTGWTVGGLAVGDSISTLVSVYDAGTEANTEAATDIPGPASGGSGNGFDAARDDLLDAVTIHGGVVTMADGLTTSALSEADRWLGPAAKITVMRTQ